MGWGHIGYQGRQDGRRILASWVNAVTIEAEIHDEENRHPWQVAATFGPKFDEWYANWLDWVGIWTGLHSAVDRGMAVKTQGNVLVESSGPDQLTGWVPPRSVRAFGSNQAATIAIAKTAARRASTPELPPLEWRIWNSARVVQDNRRAVIDAATAVEVAMARALRMRLKATPTEALEAKIKSASGIARMLK